MVSKLRLNEILNSFKNRTIAVIGDMMIDEYIFGNVSRISPEAPVPVVNVVKERFVLGGAANVVNNLSSLGAKTISFGVVGQDENAKKLIKEFSDKNVDIFGIIECEDRPTIIKKRVIAHNQQLLRLDWEKRRDISNGIEDQIISELKKNIDRIDGIILSDYDKGVLTPRLAKEVIKISNEYGKIVVVDPKPKNSLNYKGATSMTPNMKESVECIGIEIPETEDGVIELGKKIRETLDLKNLLMTRSEKGMSLFQEHEIDHIPTFAKEVYDVTGAGDTVISVYTLAAAAGASYEEAAKIANTAAGIVVGRVGTSTVTKDEIIDFYEELYNGAHSVKVEEKEI
jgi:rfaE bifunctional protein kinase chain/domain